MQKKKKLDKFTGKKVLIMGLGLHGGGVAVANYFIKHGAQVRITDLKTREELLPSLKKISPTPSRSPSGRGRIRFTLGKHLEKDFRWADMVVQNPGVPKESKYLKIARKHGAEIENEATLFFQIIGRERIIGITGTRGKSTTTALIYHMVKEKYANALLGGNIATSPMFSIIDEAKRSKDPIVLELSSWHLENLGEKKLSPHIAVFTNLHLDHLNRYKNMHEYGRAKQNIFLHQSKEDFAVLNWDNFYTLSHYKFAPSRVNWFGKGEDIDSPGCYVKDGWICFRDGKRDEKISLLQSIALLGEHNLENVLAAVCAAKVLGIENDAIAFVVKNFHGLPHRLEFIKESHGVRYVNDTSATTPDGTIAALKSLGTSNRQSVNRNIILIAGGSDKGIPQEKFNQLGELVAKHCKAVVLFDGKGSMKLFQSLKISNFQFPISNEIINMPNALGVAKSFAKRGDIILLSPACASFGLFKHEFDRGDQFKKLVGEV